MKIEIDKISKSYGNTIALDEVSFIIKEGIHLLAGPNGSGKTTLIESIVNLVKLNQGNINVDGQISVLFQENSLRTNATAQEEIYLYQKLFNTPDDYILELIVSLNLEGHISKKNSSLSIGTQRRVMILLMMMKKDANIFILDEPCSGLDVESRKIIWWTLNKVKQNKVILISEHYLNEACKYANNIIFLNQGKLVFQSDTKEYLDNFKYKFITANYSHTNSLSSNNQVTVKNNTGEYIFSVDKLTDDSIYVSLEDIYTYITGTKVYNELSKEENNEI